MFENALAFNQNISRWNFIIIYFSETANFAKNSPLANIPTNMPIWRFPTLSATGVTINYIGSEADIPSTSPRFILENPRGTGLEWFAVVTNSSRSQFTAYAKNQQNGRNYSKNYKNVQYSFRKSSKSKSIQLLYV